MNCYDAIDVMGDALEGMLGADQRTGLDEHLEECPPCRHYFEQLRITREALGRLPAPQGTSAQKSDLIAKFRREFRDGE